MRPSEYLFISLLTPRFIHTSSVLGVRVLRRDQAGPYELNHEFVLGYGLDCRLR
jgi:hypothetical protein